MIYPLSLANTTHVLLLLKFQQTHMTTFQWIWSAEQLKIQVMTKWNLPGISLLMSAAQDNHDKMPRIEYNNYSD